MSDNAPVPAPASGKLILVVDDDATIRTLIEKVARMQGFQVVTAVDGEDGAKKAAERAPDLIITDIRMPGHGGYEFLRGLLGSRSSRIPVVVITGGSFDASTIALIRQEINVVEFVRKPFEMLSFVAVLHKHLGTAPSS